MWNVDVSTIHCCDIYQRVKNRWFQSSDANRCKTKTKVEYSISVSLAWKNVSQKQEITWDDCEESCSLRWIWWEKYMTKKMFSQLLEKNCGRARGGNLNYTCLPGTKCLDYHIYHIMLWTPEQVIWVKCSLFFWTVYRQLRNCTAMFTIGWCQWWNSK